MDENKQGNLIIVTGARGAGKTTLIGELILAFQQQGVKLSGLTSPAVFEGDQKTGITAVNLATGETKRLAVYDPKPEDPSAEHRPLNWSFDPVVITWGNQVFSCAIPTDVLVVDEIGPLELNRKQGWSAALPALDSRQYDLAILVMRPELLEKSLQRWPWGEVIEVSGLDQVPLHKQEILDRFF
jgi:nucleoside-triphosphatase THEP1